MLSGRRPDRVDQRHHEAMPKWRRLYKVKLQHVHQGLRQGCCRSLICRQPADLLALYSQEAHSHASCQCICSCGVKYSFSATLRVATSVKRWKYPRHKRRVNKSSLHSPRHINSSSQTWTRWHLPTSSRWLLSLSSVKWPTRLVFLRRLPMTRRMIASAITSRKRATRPCIMTSPLRQARAICSEEGVVLVQDLLCVLVLSLALAWVAGATTTTTWIKMTAGQLRPSSMDTCTPPRVTTAYVSITLIRATPFCHLLHSNCKEW